ncbi:MAG: hypothetical protein EBU84_18195 [Actinobacteria bacterium]|nr:hypothetical protein [Actinomycetota bacterium]
MKQCEYCGSDNDGSYGSGRFCSKKCSRGFSTKSKRKEINEKVSKTLTFDPYEKTCKQCEKKFSTKKKHKKFCSRQCAINHQHSDPVVLEKWRVSRLKEIEKGNIGYGIKAVYQGIRCDSALEYAFLKWYHLQHPNAKIERFKGHLEGEGIKYQPDFIIDKKIIVEVKYTSPYIGEKLSEKWKTYLSTQEAKKKLLSEHEYLWITEKDIGNKFYRKCLEEIKKSN